MNPQSPQSFYSRQFLAGKENSDMHQKDGAGNYRQHYLGPEEPVAPPKSRPTQVERPRKEVKKIIPQRNLEFLWANNVRRFSEHERPYLSQKSVKQLESNYKELMMVEANMAGLGKGKNTYYVTSCMDRDGKTITAVSVAYGLSLYSGKEVLLVDFNQQAPQIHNMFGISDSPGFFELCEGRSVPEQVILPTAHKGLSIITIGGAQGYMKGDQDIQKAMDSLSPHFDYVICDGSSVLSSSVALRNIPIFGAVLIVIECEKTRWEVLQLAEEKIKKGGGPSSIGVVYNRRKYYIPSIVYKVISKK
jgi:Mrp family chromosome partitioning ATPase